MLVDEPLGWLITNHHMCRWVEVKEKDTIEEEGIMEEEVIITIELGESLLMR